MSFLVLGRAHVGMEGFTPNIPHVTISITDPVNGQVKRSKDVGPAELFPSKERLATLRLEFFDIEESIGDLAMMSDDQAKQVVDFANAWKDKVKLFVVHCEAGICRSAGVAAALSKWLNGEDMFFYKTYCPNRWVYKQVLKAIYGDPWADYKTEYEPEPIDPNEPLF